jgi:hypothetical protein
VPRVGRRCLDVGGCAGLNARLVVIVASRSVLLIIDLESGSRCRASYRQPYPSQTRIDGGRSVRSVPQMIPVTTMQTSEHFPSTESRRVALWVKEHWTHRRYSYESPLIPLSPSSASSALKSSSLVTLSLTGRSELPPAAPKSASVDRIFISKPFPLTPPPPLSSGPNPPLVKLNKLAAR